MRERSVNEVLNWLIVVLAFSLPVYRSWTGVASVGVLVLWFFQGNLREQIGSLRRHRMTLAIIVFLVLGLLSLLWSDHRLDGLRDWQDSLNLLLVPAIATSVDRRSLPRVWAAFMIGSILSVAMMVGVVVGGIHYRHAHPGNPSVTMSHLDYSMVLAVASLLLAVFVAHTAMPWVRRLGWLAILLVLLAGLLVNIGRSGQLAFAVGIVVVLPLLLHGRPWPIRLGALAAVVGALLVVYSAAPRFHDRIDDSVSEVYHAVVDREMDGNQGKRVAGIVVGLEIVRDHPILGTGLGAVMPEFHRRLDTEFPEYREAIGWFAHLHNQYLQIATELGIVGLGSLLAIFAALILGRYRHPMFRSAALALGCAYLVGFLGDPFLQKQIPLALFALAAGIISADDEAFADESRPSTVDRQL